jgi:hypothetical protein
MNMSAFTPPYDPLDAARREIRVLWLDKTPGIVRCHLERVSLDDYNPKYARYLQGNMPTNTCDEVATKNWIDVCLRNCDQNHDA